MSKFITVEAWVGQHSGGTKFYQIVTFRSANGHSFSIRQNGPSGVFTAPGKLASGSIALDEQLVGAPGNNPTTYAGVGKRQDKTADGYTFTRELYESHDTVSAALQFVKANFGLAAQRLANPILRSEPWEGINVSTPVWEPPAPIVHETIAPEERSAEWNSW